MLCAGLPSVIIYMDPAAEGVYPPDIFRGITGIAGKEENMKIVTVVGARPQFIKAAAGSRALRKEHEEILVHTGQHFDDNMSAVFFREMGVPSPDYNLGISGGTHAQMTARMLTGIEEVLVRETQLRQYSLN